MTRAILSAVLLVALAAAPAGAQMPAGQEMPDLRQMSGQPLPDGALPVGTLTVRVIRGDLTKPVVNQIVEMMVGGTEKKPTDDKGRAQFSGLTPGTRVKAFTVVDGERLETKEIEMPAAGGVRVMLVATDPEAAAREAEDRRLAKLPPQRGIVVLGEQSRFVFETGEDGLNVFNLLQIVNSARTPVDTGFPIVFSVPDGAEQVSLLEESTPLGKISGNTVEVRGPFPPGTTQLQFGYTMPYSGSELKMRQLMPVQLTQVTVVAQKAGDMRLSSAQIAQQREMSSEGQTYILGQGPAVAAGSAVEFAFTGIPHPPTWPRNVALALVVLILLGGVLASLRAKRTSGDAARRALEARRERLFGELVELEEAQRAGRLAPAVFAARRHQLVTSLERVYAALDEEQAA